MAGRRFEVPARAAPLAPRGHIRPRPAPPPARAAIKAPGREEMAPAGRGEGDRGRDAAHRPARPVSATENEHHSFLFSHFFLP